MNELTHIYIVVDNLAIGGTPPLAVFTTIQKANDFIKKEPSEFLEIYQYKINSRC